MPEDDDIDLKRHQKGHIDQSQWITVSDEEMNVIDLVNGLDDLHNGIIRFIGNPEKRIKEDPLRILRAERFKIKLHFEFEEQTRFGWEVIRHFRGF